MSEPTTAAGRATRYCPACDHLAHEKGRCQQCWWGMFSHYDCRASLDRQSRAEEDRLRSAVHRGEA